MKLVYVECKTCKGFGEFLGYECKLCKGNGQIPVMITDEEEEYETE